MSKVIAPLCMVLLGGMKIVSKGLKCRDSEDQRLKGIDYMIQCKVAEAGYVNNPLVSAVVPWEIFSTTYGSWTGIPHTFSSVAQEIFCVLMSCARTHTRGE